MSIEIDVNINHIEKDDVDDLIGKNGTISGKNYDSEVETVDAHAATLVPSPASEVSPISNKDIAILHPTNLEDKSAESDVDSNEIESSETNSDLRVVTGNSCSTLSLAVPEISLNMNTVTSEASSVKIHGQICPDVAVSSTSSAILISPENVTTERPSLLESPDNKATNMEFISKKTKDQVTNGESTNSSQNNVSFIYTDLRNVHSNLAMSTVSLDEHSSSKNVFCMPPYSRSAENISLLEQNDKNVNSGEIDLNAEKILSEFASQKTKVAAVQKIPETPSNVEVRNTRMPKEILSQDIGSIVKNVHGIFSSMSGSLKSAYSYRTSIQKPAKPIPNGKIMNDIFEHENTVSNMEETDDCVENILNLNIDSMKQEHESIEDESDVAKDVARLQIQLLERAVAAQRRENVSLRERVKQQVDELQEKDHTCKELEGKLDLMIKRVEQTEREKNAAVMRYAGVECARIEAKRAADLAAKNEKAAHTEVELLSNKLKSAHGEKQRICQLYDDKCHELQSSEREVGKVREELRELEGRLKWTQSKLRMEMDAYKESSERAEKLSQQITELEAARETAAANATDHVKAKQLESELKESRAALILCRHEKEELEKRLNSASSQLDSCTRERDAATTSLARTTVEVEQLKISNMRLEEEAAELAALRAQAALADTLGAQLHRETERASQAEEALSVERALGETCARREAAALEHAARLTAQHVAHRAAAEHHEAKAQALSVDNASLRERICALEEQCAQLQSALTEQTDRRHKENRVLARKVAEMTEEVAEASKKLEWEKGENGVLKKKHASAIKELNRELQRALKRCEQLEAKLPPPDATSTRTGSVSSLSSGESAPHDERLHNGHTDTLPDIQVREPDRQALIERIVSLQRAAARRAERCDFLEEHAKQLTGELRAKSRLLRSMLCELPAGAVASQDRDVNKKEIARLGGGAMAAVWGGDPGGMTLELSLEMNKRLQAVLEDTLLKNITLKENMDTLGAEISRLKEQDKTNSDAK